MLIKNFLRQVIFGSLLFNFFSQKVKKSDENPHLRNKRIDKISWKTYEVVDGLRNEDVAFLISSTMVKDEMFQYQRIIPSARTWMQYFVNVFVLLEDNFSSRFSLRHCSKSETAHYTAFSCPEEPTYVLSRNCTNIYYGASGPCCKVDDLFNYLVNEREDIFSHLKYAIHADDDSYFRGDQLLRYLAAVDKSGVSHFPMIGNAEKSKTSPFPEKGGGVWHIKNCTEIHTHGWYQPLLLNRAAMIQMRTAFANHGVTDICSSFGVTHDVGMGPFAWLFGVYHIELPRTELNARHAGYSVFKPQQLIVHYVKIRKEDDCVQNLRKWPFNMKYKQDIVIGCGDLGHSGPLHDRDRNVDMYDAHQYFLENGIPLTVGRNGDSGFLNAKVILEPDPVRNGEKRVKTILEYSRKEGNSSFDGVLEPGESVEWRVIPRLVKLSGYEKTEHYRLYNITEEWTTFTMLDCEDPGYVRGK